MNVRQKLTASALLLGSLGMGAAARRAQAQAAPQPSGGSAATVNPTDPAIQAGIVSAMQIADTQVPVPTQKAAPQAVSFEAAAAQVNAALPAFVMSTTAAEINVSPNRKMLGNAVWAQQVDQLSRAIYDFGGTNKLTNQYLQEASKTEVTRGPYTYALGDPAAPPYQFNLPTTQAGAPPASAAQTSPPLIDVGFFKAETIIYRASDAALLGERAVILMQKDAPRASREEPQKFAEAVQGLSVLASRIEDTKQGALAGMKNVSTLPAATLQAALDKANAAPAGQASAGPGAAPPQQQGETLADRLYGTPDANSPAMNGNVYQGYQGGGFGYGYVNTNVYVSGGGYGYGVPYGGYGFQHGGPGFLPHGPVVVSGGIGVYAANPAGYVSAGAGGTKVLNTGNHGNGSHPAASPAAATGNRPAAKPAAATHGHK